MVWEGPLTTRLTEEVTLKTIDSSLSWEAAVVPLSCMSAKGLAKVPSLGTPSLLKQGLFKVPYSQRNNVTRHLLWPPEEARDQQ